jgi:hypothetical protein
MLQGVFGALPRRLCNGADHLPPFPSMIFDTFRMEPRHSWASWIRLATTLGADEALGGASTIVL